MSDYRDLAPEPLLPIRPRAWDVFISYAREDTAIALALSEAIARRGLSTWLDAKLKIGDPLNAIDQAVRSSGAVIVLLSNASLSSRWLRREVTTALEALPRECVIPIAVGDVDVRNLPSWLADRQWLHLRDGRRVNKLVDQLLPALDIALGGSDSAAGSARVIGQLPQRVPLVGVESYLRELRAQRIGLTWIVGMGGMGKTTLAREYAFQVRNDVDFIWWLSCVGAQASEIDEQLRLLTEQEGRTSAPVPGLVVVDGFDAVSDELRDQVVNLGALAAWHRILITTRRVSDSRSLHDHFYSVLTVGPLSEAAVADYLDSFAPDLRPQDRAELVRIAKTTGGSPLALRLVTQALRSQSVETVLSPAASPESMINRTLHLLLDELSADQRRRLDVLAFCSELLSMIRTSDRWRLPDDDALFARMLDWGLCSERVDGTFFAHQIIAGFLRENAPRDALADAIEYVTRRLPDPSEADSRTLLPSVVELTELTELGWSPTVSANLAELLIWQASVWRSAGEPERAELLCPRALMLAAESEQTVLRIRTMNLQSALAFDRGRIAEASAIEKRTADIALAELGPNHPIAIASLANLATSLRAQGDLPEAITLLRRVVERSRATMPSGHPDLAAAQSNLAICLREAGLAEEAMALLKEAVSHTTNARLRLQMDQILAAVLTDVGRLDEAALVLTESLARTAGSQTSGSSDVLTARANLAMVYARLGRLDDALQLQSEVVDRFELLHGPHQPATLSARSNYALLLSETGSTEEARHIFTEVAASRARILGSEHPETLQSLLLAARATRTQGNNDRALEMYSGLLARVVRVLGPEHAMSFTVREEYAQQLGLVGNLSAAQLAYRELLADLERALPPEHPMVLRVRQSVARSR